MKKAQMEVIGLVVLVVIIIVAVGLFIRLSVLKPVSHSATSVDSIEANNLLNALLKTTICVNEKKSVVDAIKQCKIKQDICGEEPCQYSVNKIKEIMGAVLEEKENYDLLVLADQDAIINIKNCKTGVAASPVYFFDANFHYTIKLKLCTK